MGQKGQQMLKSQGKRQQAPKPPRLNNQKVNQNIQAHENENRLWSLTDRPCHMLSCEVDLFLYWFLICKLEIRIPMSPRGCFKDLNLETILKHLVKNDWCGTSSAVTAFAPGCKDEKAHFREKGTS